MAQTAVPSLAAERAAIEERLAADIDTALRRHLGGLAAMKAGLRADLAATARGYADTVQAQALADVAKSLDELVVLARAHLGDPKRAAARKT